ncbi:MAG: hypothetical protein AAFX94_10245 [Myxococcota bacterium]
MGRDGEKPPKERRRRQARRKAGDSKSQKRSHRTAPNPGRVSKPKGKPKASGPVEPSRAVRAPKKKKKTPSAAKPGPKKTSSRRSGRAPRSPGLSREVQESASTVAPEVQLAVDEFMIRALRQAEKTLRALERESREEHPSATRQHARARKEIFAEATGKLQELRRDLERRRANLSPPTEDP